MVKENLPKEFSIYNGLTVSLMVLPINDGLTVPITPFVESVVQYYHYPLTMDMDIGKMNVWNLKYI